MSMRLVSGGTYNVRASEMSSHLQDRQPKMVTCIVHFLDDSQQDFEVDKKAKSQVLLDKVFGHLELVEKDYFGLQFVDLSPAPDGMVSHAHLPVGPYAMRWLDPLKTIKKQCRGPPYEFYFRVKFYVSDPSKLEEEYTRYHFFLQVKRDILEGRLVTPPSTSALLASFAIQSELGDYNPDEHKGNYISDYRFIPHQTEDFEKQVSELHKQHRGQTPADAEYHYLDKAKRLEMYGVDLHNARVSYDREIPVSSPFYDQNNIDIQLGVTSVGLVVFQNNVKINTFPWAKIVKISFKRKQFFIQLRREVNDSVENLIGFNMISYRSCKNLWKSCVEHHTFFRLYVPNPPSKKIFSMGSKFRYSGRTEFQTLEENKRRAKIERTFSRSPSKKFARRTVSGHTRDQIIQERNFIDGHRNLPKSHTFGGTPSTARPKSSNCVNHSFNRYESVSNQKRATLPHDYKIGSPARSSIHSSKSDDDGGFISHKIPANTYPQPVPIKVVDVNIPDKDNHTDTNSELPAYDEYLPNGNSHSEGHGLVTIRMRPDDQGRFGFNVKGGADQGMPIIVSRVAPGTPADLAIPRLNEGDQVLFINGRDVSQHTHEQVVMFIRASRETHSGELVLIVRPNVYVGEEAQEEPNLEYLPENYQIIAPGAGTGTNALEASLMLLQESLDSGAALAQFEQLYRKKPGMTMNAARLDVNIAKNRYRDISPYDQTRVILKEQNVSGGDYINANYVNMEIPGSGIVNRYIAAQGPLPKTCTDFWQMVWEQHSSLVVMLTTKVEKGRVKCHQYWPEMYETMDYGLLQITCVKEEETPSFAFREFNLTHAETNEERHISHMQYIAWPDHNVPDDPADFLEFVLRVRQRRMGMVEPTVVHCSAGIGRTGVLITMETAMCLIEANQPVYPLSIVRQMRDQRAMLIQTATQYKFVCEAILKVYNEELVKPLEDYQR
ncbi:tyrosine-protein phosphatase non-receptor type 4-like isoform X2 [Saccostrea echinata]|uniref:tyrosine-protein phosphatase non-receptor type 4-like isoform X2 n=1 Tax=Saccostrea echinata TaxID=191078 RepID=UPI002A81345D|nr:tyrosine-protein phosphatase non-receptor type 4-like isoform X2 [Saccostrea echinata]